MEPNTTIEEFYGVYLLCSESTDKRYNGRCYIGYTVNPNRRIKQHNRGKDFGGAKKTNNKGPWKMVLIIHGFPNNISALQFEWAWQNPNVSVRLKHNPSVTKKRRNESFFQYNFRILTEMLSTSPWNRLPLTIRWLASDLQIPFPLQNSPPLHMQVCNGSITVNKRTNKKIKNLEATNHIVKLIECHLCMEIIENVERSKLVCLNPKCKFVSHIICLAKLWLVNANDCGHYVPIEGDCPLCETHYLWGDLIRKKNYCSLNDNKESLIDDDHDDNDSDNDDSYNDDSYNDDINIITLSSEDETCVD